MNPIVAIGYSIYDSNVKIVFQFSKALFGQLFLTKLGILDFAGVNQEARWTSKEAFGWESDSEPYPDFLAKVSPKGVENIIFINLYCGQSLKTAFHELKAIRRILNITKQEKTLSYFCELVARTIEYCLNEAI